MKNCAFFIFMHFLAISYTQLINPENQSEQLDGLEIRRGQLGHH